MVQFSSRRGKRWIIGVLAVVAALVVAPVGLRSAATWLIVDEPLRSARAVVVLGGQLPFRAVEAAAIYRQGLAAEVWLTQGGLFEEDSALAKLGIERPEEHVYSQLVLERLGVPRPAIVVLPGRNANTAGEIQTVSAYLRQSRGDRVILVTSKYHTRRVRAIWQAVVGAQAEAIVRFAPSDPADPIGWWHNTADALAVSREWLGLLNVWAGFPVAPRHMPQ